MKPNPMGATFTERAAAASGASEFEGPNLDAPRAVPNSTFASRAGIAEPEPEPEVDEKAVEVEDTANKAVQASDNKSGRSGNRRRS